MMIRSSVSTSSYITTPAVTKSKEILLLAGLLSYVCKKVIYIYIHEDGNSAFTSREITTRERKSRMPKQHGCLEMRTFFFADNLLYIAKNDVI